MPDHPLGSLGLQIKAHWKKYRPTMYAALEQSLPEGRRGSLREEAGEEADLVALALPGRGVNGQDHQVGEVL